MAVQCHRQALAKISAIDIIYFCPDNSAKDHKQDGRLARAYLLPNCKYFDQFLQTVKNKTTVLILVFKDFLQINSTADFCTLCKRVSRFSLEKFSSHSAKKFRRGTLLCFRKFLLSKNVRDKRGGGTKIFRRKLFVSQCRKIS